MRTAEIRRRFLEFFERRGHTVVPSAPLLLDDPTLLFVNAGMVPFKPYFLGQEKPPWPRAASVQKCVRTLDIDEVGKTTRHGTFFQMNGNFSFGDYFKDGAIELAWELCTRAQSDGGLGFEESRLWASIYQDDEEAHAAWRRIVGLPEERIVRRGPEDNFWSMGVAGPCGPDSEIFYDTGKGPEGGPAVDETRYLEIWNLVFMQWERGPGGDEDIVGNLPAKNIDTGMGLERVAYLLQGVDNIYEIDEVRPVLDRAAELAGKRYEGGDPDDDVRLRVIADHVRSGLMLASDGVTPGNEARGYVLRRLLRRVIRSMRLLGVDEPVLPELVTVGKDAMVSSYPELEATFTHVRDAFRAEEETFRRTLATGTTILDTAVRRALSPGGSRRIGGEAAFALHDTYGFPIELTLEMAAEQGVEVDAEGFRRLMAEQRQRARADAKAKKSGYADVAGYLDIAEGLGREVEFTGYHDVVDEATVAGLLRAGEPVPAAGEGAEVDVVLDRTPFYAEGGGQLADHGLIEADGVRVEVLDVQKPVAGIIVHRARVVTGELTTGASVQAKVDVGRRKAISRSHTATHMVHKAIREALGEHAAQAGSENSPGRFRFDFTASSAVPASVLADVEARVNALLVDDLPVSAEVMPIDEAVRSGAMSLFTEKYGDEVRVVSVGDWARELCGGTHAQRSGQLGLVTLIGESSIGSGVRRIEALVATDAHRFLAREHAVVAQLTEMLKGRPAELPDRVARLMEQLRAADKELAWLRADQALAAAGSLAQSARDVGGVAYVGHRAPDGTGADDLRRLALEVRGRLDGARPAVVVVAAVVQDRPLVVTAVSEAARAAGLRAGELVRVAAQAMGGNGGGKDDVAQGGGRDAGAVQSALDQVAAAVGAKVAAR